MVEIVIQINLTFSRDHFQYFHIFFIKKFETKIMFSLLSNLPRPLMIGSGLTAVFGVAVLIKETNGGNQYRSDVMIEDKVVIITGANTGIGKETAKELAARKAKVYMACRDMKKCEAAREEIVLDTKNKYVYCRKCDLASMESIRNFVKQFKKEEKRLDVLINNAGVMRPPQSKTRDGFELQLGVNHMGHFLLTNLLLDNLKESAPSRIINVSSIAHKRGTINKDDLNSEVKYDKAEAYAQSKLANVLFTNELAKKLQGTGVTANSVHPGIVDSDINRHMGFYNSWTAKIFMRPFIWPFIKSPRHGSYTTIYVACKPELEKVTGKYFSNCEEDDVSDSAKDESLAAWLWAVSEKWTRLKESKELLTK